MWARLRAGLRRFPLDAGRWLGSWRLSVVLMITAALYYGFLAVWSASSPQHVVQSIASLLPFWLVYALLLANTAVCFWRRLPTLRQQISSAATLTDRPPSWSRATAPGLTPAEARGLLRLQGFRVRATESGLFGLRRRWSALGSYLFHGAFFLLAAGFLLSLATRAETRVWVAVGEELDDEGGQILSMSPPRLLSSGARPPRFAVEGIEPRFWGDQLLFTELTAVVRWSDGARSVTRINRPLWLGWGTFVRLSGFGYTPRWELRHAHAGLLDSAFAKMRLFPPGERDLLRIPGLPHRFYLQVFPDFAVVDGAPTTRSPRLVEPAVRVDVFRGHHQTASAVLRPQDALRFEDLALSLPEIRYWGEFSVVRDPGAGVVVAAYLLALVGLVLKLPGARQEVVWLEASDGGGLVRGWGASRLGDEPEETGLEMLR